MNFLHRLFFSLSLVVMLLVHGASAQTLSEALDKVEAREREASNLTFNWSLHVENTTSGLSKVKFDELCGSLRRAFGATMSEAELQAKFNSLKVRLKDKKYNYDAPYTFSNFGNRLAISGTVVYGLPDKIATTMSEFYEGGNGLVAVTGDKTGAGKPLAGSLSTVWQEPGDSIRHQNPVGTHLLLDVPDLNALSGKNPFLMYEVLWKATMLPDGNIALDADIVDEAMFPAHVHQILDKKHDYLPVDCSITMSFKKITYHINHFTKHTGNWFDDFWFADDVSTLHDAPGKYKIERHWQLKSMKPSENVSFDLPSRSQQVVDYRLLTTTHKHPRFEELVEADKREDFVRYTWPGHFPSLDELRTMRAAASTAPSIGAARQNPMRPLLIVASVLMMVGCLSAFVVRRRGKGEDRDETIQK